MSNMTSFTCEGCQKKITDKGYLKCASCNEIYDLACVGITDKWFDNIMTPASKASWKCPRCQSKEPKGDRCNTPIRPHWQPDLPHQENPSTKPKNDSNNKKIILEDSNVTIRRQPPPSRRSSTTLLSGDDSITSPHTQRNW